MDRRQFLASLAASALIAPAFAQEAAAGPDAYVDQFWSALVARKRVLDAAFIDAWFSKAAAGRLLTQLRVRKPEYTDRLVWSLSKSLFDETLDSTLRARIIRAEPGKAEVALEAPDAAPSTFKAWLVKEKDAWRIDEFALEYASSLRELLETPPAAAPTDAAPSEAATAFVEKTIRAALAAARKTQTLLSDPAQIRQLCEAKLAAALLKEASNKDDAETRLDFDPVLGGQDSKNVADLATRVIGAHNGLTLVEARWKDGANAMRALFDIGPGPKGWVLYDITHYSLDKLDQLFQNELK